MSKKLFSLSDINEEMLQYADKYIKTVITNAKNGYYRKELKSNPYDIVIVDLSESEELLMYGDNEFEKIFAFYIETREVQILVHNEYLAKALMQLSKIQRDR